MRTLFLFATVVCAFDARSTLKVNLSQLKCEQTPFQVPSLPNAALVFAPHADKQEQVQRQNERAISELQKRAQNAPAISPEHAVCLHNLRLPRALDFTTLSYATTC